MVKPQTVQAMPQFRANDVVHVIGRKGSGKSKVSMYIFDKMHTRSKIILNSKPDADLLKKWPQTTQKINGAPKAGITHVARYLTQGEQLTGWDDILSLWTHGNTLFYFDELPNHATASKWPDHLQRIVQTGRSFGDGAIFCSQRPVNVPNFTLSEADHLIVFYTQLKSDREKLEGATGYDWSFLRDLPPYHFGYYSQRLGPPIVMKPVPLI